jgi:hypothetical protein
VLKVFVKKENEDEVFVTVGFQGPSIDDVIN